MMFYQFLWPRINQAESNGVAILAILAFPSLMADPRFQLLSTRSAWQSSSNFLANACRGSQAAKTWWVGAAIVCQLWMWLGLGWFRSAKWYKTPSIQPASQPAIHPSVRPSIYLHLMKSWDWYQLDTLWQDGHCLSTTNPWTREFLGHAWTCLDHSALGRANGWLSLCLVMHVGSSDHSSAIAWFGIPRLLTPCVWAVDIIAYIVPRWWLKRAGPGFQPGICRMQLHFQHVSTRGGQWWKPLYQYVQIPSRRRWCCIWLRPSVAPEFDLLLRPLHWRARWTAAASCHSQLDVFLYICACINLLIYLFI